ADDVAAFDVPVEVEIFRAGEERMRGLLQAATLLGFLAHVDESDRRSLHAVHLLHEARGHPGELKDVVLVGVHRRAGIEKARRLPLRCGKHPAERRTVNAADAPEEEQRGSHGGAGVAGGNDGIRLAMLHERGRDADRRVRPPPERAAGCSSIATTSRASRTVIPGGTAAPTIRRRSSSRPTRMSSAVPPSSRYNAAPRTIS